MKLAGLGIWNVYFVIKFVLLYFAAIGFNALENVAFFAFLMLHPSSSQLAKVKAFIAVPIAIVLFYFDAIAVISGVSEHTLANILPALIQIFSLETVLLVFIVGVLYWYLSQWIRFTTVTVACFIVTLFFAPNLSQQQHAEQQSKVQLFSQ